MPGQIASLKALLSPRGWSSQISAWIAGLFAAIFEAGSLALILPLATFVLSAEPAAIGPIAVSRESLVAAVILLYVAGLAVRVFALRFTMKTTLSVGYGLAARLFARVLDQPQTWHTRHHSAELRTLLLHDAQELMSLVTIPLGRLLAQGALVLCVGTLMLVVRPVETAVAALVLVTCYALVFALSGQRLTAITATQIQNHALRHRYSTDALNAIREVRLSRLETEFSRSFAAACEGIAASGGARTLFSELPRLMLEAVLFAFLITFMLLLASGREAQDPAALSTLMVFAAAGLKLFPIGHMLYANLASLRSGQPLLDKLARFVDGLEPPLEPAPVPPVTNGFTLDAVSFTHHGSAAPTLRDLSLSVGRGTSLAITGPSGSGKSTLIDIIAGLIMPDAGAVEVEGVRLTARHAPDWQGQLRYCPQKPALFDTDIVGNVTIGADFDRDRLQRALHIACLDDLPFPAEGHPVGELGRRLSGGQVQRIGLARALYGAAPILILDEPTGNLDARTAERFLDRLFAAQGDTIVLIVTHDPRVISRCAQVLELDGP
ncbi:ATP-binding cassette domain-containing protein [Pelagibacterium lacus]|nr:ABC transporter ATP-binding protein [Pelagibacterium lacus]